MKELSAEVLAEALDYDPETGFLTWKKKTARTVKVGERAGMQEGKRYLMVQVYGQTLAIHRVAFLLMTGACPEVVDHINRDMHDNRWVNLRAATTSENACNSFYRTNTSGVKNVHYCRDGQRKKRFVVSFRIGDKIKNFGRFETLDLAAARAEELRKEMHGSFARATPNDLPPSMRSHSPHVPTFSDSTL